MWLVNTKKETSLELFLESELPTYAILSHTWGSDEVSFQDMQSMFRRPKQGWAKIKSACEQAEKDGFHYLWADTCCIDKTSSAELQEAINSMFRWYQQAAVCYVYLSDVQCPVMTDNWAQLQVPGEGREIRVIGSRLQRWKQIFAESRWFTRGWTLQELIAPRDCVFFNVDWTEIGTKSKLIKTISQITGVEPSVLTHDTNLFSISVAKRMSWAAKRRTSRIEDRAYSLLGIFDVNIPMLYGEGNKAFLRLQEEIIKNSTDHSIFAWESTDAHHTGNLLAESPANFANANKIIQLGQSESFNITNRGLRISLSSQALDSISLNRNHTWAALNCRFENDISGVIALRLTRYSEGDEYHAVRHENARDVLQQPWDLDSVVKFGKDSRLVFIKTKHLVHAVKSPMSITRKYEPRHSPVVFAVDTTEGAGDTDAVYPQHIWSVEDGLVNTIKQPRMRAGMLISRNSKERWVVVFGFDQDDDAEHDRLVPHLAVRIFTGTETMRKMCELSGSYASTDRADRTKLLAKASCVSQPGELLVSLQRSEMMGTLVYTVRIEFSSFPELDSIATQRVLPEPKIVKTLSDRHAALSGYHELDADETQRAILVSSHQQSIDNALRERRTTHLFETRKQIRAQSRLPLLGADIKLKLWIRLDDHDFKLREIFPKDALQIKDGIVAYSSTATKAVTLGMLIESPEGVAYNVFVYHGYQQRSRMFAERPSSIRDHVLQKGPLTQLLDGDITPASGVALGQDPSPEEGLTPDENLASENNPPRGEGLVHDEIREIESGQEQSEGSSPATLQKDEVTREQPSSHSDCESDVSDNSSGHQSAQVREVLSPNIQLFDSDGSNTPEGGTGGVLAWLNAGEESLENMTETIERCNRGIGLCGNACHDRTSHSYTFAKVTVDTREKLRVDMSQFPTSGVTAIVVDIRSYTPRNESNPIHIGSRSEAKDLIVSEEIALASAGSNEFSFDLSQPRMGEGGLADRRPDPGTNYADTGTDYSTLAGLRTGVEIDIPETEPDQM